MKDSQTYQSLMDACAQPGCPVCTVVQGAVEKYIDSLFYESILDPEARSRLRNSLGFCNAHAWLAVDARLSDALGLAILYHDLVGTVMGNMEAAPSEPCPACNQEDILVTRIIETISGALSDNKFVHILKQSDGLCLPHLRLVIEGAHNRRSISSLLDLQRVKLAELQSELAEFIRKNDYRFQSERFGPERDSYKRAVSIVNGKNRHRIR